MHRCAKSSSSKKSLLKLSKEISRLTSITKKKRSLSKKKLKTTKNNENTFSDMGNQASRVLEKENSSRLNAHRILLVLELIVVFVVAFYLTRLDLLIIKESSKRVTIMQRIALDHVIYYIVTKLNQLILAMR